MHHRPATTHAARRARLLPFWGRFVLLNIILFLPQFVLANDGTPLWAARRPTDWLLWRDSSDPLRLNAELSVLAALLALALPRLSARAGRALVRLAAALYLALLGYYLYDAAMRGLFQLDPNLYGQYRLIIDNVPALIAHLRVAYWLYALGLLLVAAAAWLLARQVAQMAAAGVGLGRRSRLALIALALLVLPYALYFGRALAGPKVVVSSVTVKLVDNAARSLALATQIAQYTQATPEAVYDLTGYDLTRRPDIYLIFVESYGSVLYNRSDYARAYTQRLAELEQALADDGWQAVSALSTAPTWGGGSWLSYTSALFGLRVDSHAQYLALREQYQAQAYPDLGSYLRAQGYTYTWVSAIAGGLPADEEALNARFFGHDRVVTYTDLAYAGARYGWGPAPPDQYVLRFVDATIVQPSATPQFVVYVTQNSHYPWDPQPTLAADWRALAQPAPDPAPNPLATISPVLRRQNYWQAIDYQLQALGELIASVDGRETLFVLVGDHQPQQVSRAGDGFATPIHIISRDPALLDRFRPHGFSRGLIIPEAQRAPAPAPGTASASASGMALEHAGLYSLLTHALLAQYSLQTRVPPRVLPQGLLPGAAPLPATNTQ